MNENRRKFKKLAEGRTNKTLAMIRKIKRLNNKAAYEFSNKDIEAICKAIEDGVREVREHFKTERPKKIVFKLDPRPTAEPSSAS